MKKLYGPRGRNTQENMSIFTSISAQERIDFTKNLAIMLKSGVPINEALFSIAEQSRARAFKESITRVQKSVEKGTSLSGAIEKEKRAFDKVFTSLIVSGEASGTLPESLSFLSNWLERNNDLRKEISAATLYPKLVLGATFLLGGGLAVFILPRLTPLFSQLHVELPFTTRFLLALTQFLENFWVVSLVFVVGTVVGVTYLGRYYLPVRKFFHLLSIRAPFFGSIFISYQLALLFELLGTQYKSGIPIVDSLHITAEAATNIHYSRSLAMIKEHVSRGSPLSKCMKEFPKLYPANVINIIAAGERSGTLEESFKYLAEFYSKEVSTKTKKLPTIIEPMLLVFIALAVGFVALAIISPIYELTGSINR